MYFYHNSTCFKVKIHGYMWYMGFVIGPETAFLKLKYLSLKYWICDQTDMKTYQYGQQITLKWNMMHSLLQVSAKRWFVFCCRGNIL